MSNVERSSPSKNSIRNNKFDRKCDASAVPRSSSAKNRRRIVQTDSIKEGIFILETSSSRIVDVFSPLRADSALGSLEFGPLSYQTWSIERILLVFCFAHLFDSISRPIASSSEADLSFINHSSLFHICLNEVIGHNTQHKTNLHLSPPHVYLCERVESVRSLFIVVII